MVPQRRIATGGGETRRIDVESIYSLVEVGSEFFFIAVILIERIGRSRRLLRDIDADTTLVFTLT